jgi:hypothetical protein
MWGLCVTAYNNIDRHHEEIFYEPEKTWKKAARLNRKWEEERKTIVSRNRIEHQEDYGFDHMDLSGSGNYKVRDYNRNHYIDERRMDSFMFNLFSPEELTPIDDPNIEARPLQQDEKPWIYPDFASDAVIFGKPKKSRAHKEKVIIEPDPIQYEIIKEEETPQPVENISVPAVIPLSVPEPLPPVSIAPPVPEPQTPADLPPEPPKIRHAHWVKKPQSSPVSSMGGFGYPQWPSYGPGPQPMGGFPYNGFGNNIPPPPLPTSLDEIDFVSNDHPDPLADYKNPIW